LEILTHEEAFW